MLHEDAPGRLQLRHRIQDVFCSPFQELHAGRSNASSEIPAMLQSSLTVVDDGRDDFSYVVLRETEPDVAASFRPTQALRRHSRSVAGPLLRHGRANSRKDGPCVG